MGRDHSCEVCGRGGFNDPDGACECPREQGLQSGTPEGVASERRACPLRSGGGPPNRSGEWPDAPSGVQQSRPVPAADQEEDAAETFAQHVRERGYPHDDAIKTYGARLLARHMDAWEVAGRFVVITEEGVEVSGPVPAVPVDGLREAVQRVVTRQPWQADWPECLNCSAPISPEVKTGRHHSPYDCLREVRKQRDALAGAVPADESQLREELEAARSQIGDLQRRAFEREQEIARLAALAAPVAPTPEET